MDLARPGPGRENGYLDGIRTGAGERKADLDTADPQLTVPAANVGSHDVIRALGRAAITFVPSWITAHARTDAPIFPGSSFTGVTEWLRSCLVPTLLAGTETAA